MEETPPPAQPYGEMEAAPASRDSPNLPGDAELLGRVGRGDEAAFRALIDRHARYLTGIALTLCGNAADAEDLVQETFAASLTGRFRGESSVRTWLVQILVRRVAMLRRGRRRERGSAPAAGAEPTSRPETLGTDARLDLAEMLKRLPPDQRQVIVLREIEGMSYAAMAGALDVPQGTVESRLHRARAALREMFKGYL